MMYLYVGSIVAIMCIYITVLLDNCPSFGGGGGGGRARGSSKKPHKSVRAGDPETGSVGSGLGTLRRAHIDRTKVSRTSFYLRVGALGKQTPRCSNASAVRRVVVHHIIRDRSRTRHRRQSNEKWFYVVCILVFISFS